MTTIAWGTLLDVHMGGTSRNSYNILVPRPETETDRGQTQPLQLFCHTCNEVRENVNKKAVRCLPGTLQRARHFLAGRAISTAHTALIKAPARADNTITSSLDTLALNTHCGGVWAAGCAVGHLGAAEKHKWNFRFMSSKVVT